MERYLLDLMDFEITPKVHLKHPVIGAISFQDHQHANAVKGESYEVALFDHDGEWIVNPMEPFSDYHDGSTYETAVYNYVPIHIVNDFLWEYSL